MRLLVPGVLACVLVPGMAVAQGGAGTSPEAEIEIEGEADDATPAKEPKITAPAATPAPDAPIADSPRPTAPRFEITPFGYLRMVYKVVRNDPDVSFVGRDDGFELQNARFGVVGKLLERVSYKFAIEGALDERLQVNVPDGKLGLRIRDAYSDVAIGGGVSLRAGFFRPLVDPDLDDDTFREFIDQNLVTRGVRPTQGFQTDGLAPGRSIGAALRLDPAPAESTPRFGFELAVQNGADEYSSDNDNDIPAVSGTLLFRMPRGGYVMGAVRYNRRTEGDLPLRRDEDDFQGSVGTRFAAGPAAFQATGFVQRTAFPTTSGPVRNSYGANAQLVFTFAIPSPVGFGYRFAFLDPSSLILTDRIMEHTFGAVVAVPSYRMRFQLQYVHAREQAARTLSNDRVQLAAELAL